MSVCYHYNELDKNLSHFLGFARLSHDSFYIIYTMLTLPVQCISESCLEMKIKLFSHFFVMPQRVL